LHIPVTPSSVLNHYPFYSQRFPASPILSLFFFQCYGDHRDLHSFPTRRSSDLWHSNHEHNSSEPYFPTRGHRCLLAPDRPVVSRDRKSTRLNSSHVKISYAVFCLKKKKKKKLSCMILSKEQQVRDIQQRSMR